MRGFFEFLRVTIVLSLVPSPTTYVHDAHERA